MPPIDDRGSMIAAGGAFAVLRARCGAAFVAAAAVTIAAAAERGPETWGGCAREGGTGLRCGAATGVGVGDGEGGTGVGTEVGALVGEGVGCAVGRRVLTTTPMHLTPPLRS